MKRVNSGQTVTCQGQELLVACVYASSDITITVFNSNGVEVPVDTVTASRAFTLPGHVGVRYRFAYAAGSVDVAGASDIN
jgi:hypothetical protein